jgi:hypothetical protein
LTDRHTHRSKASEKYTAWLKGNTAHDTSRDSRKTKGHVVTKDGESRPNENMRQANQGMYSMT